MDENLSQLAQEICKRADIVDVISSYIEVKKKGREYVAQCPFHDDSSPSLMISKEKQLFKCFVDGTGGSVIKFVQEYEHISFYEAMVKVAKFIGYDDPRLHTRESHRPKDEKKETLLRCTKDLTAYYQYALNTKEGKEGLDYFESRHLYADMRAKYRLGYAFQDGENTCKFLQSKGHSLKTIDDIGISMIKNNVPVDKNQGRVVFPIADEDGNIIGYSARRLKESDESKYVNSPETYLFNKSSVLYNYHIAKEKARIAGYVYVLEGFMDVFALARVGIDSAVAIMGTALTKEQIALLRKLNVEVRVCLDGDLPGQSATIKVARKLEEAGLHFRIVDTKGNVKDPDEILNQDGEESLKYYLNNLVDRLDFALNYYKRTNPLKTIEEKKVLVKELIPFLAVVNSQLELDSYLRKVSDITGFEVESLRGLIKNYRPDAKEGNDATRVIRDFHPERKVLRRLNRLERGILSLMIKDNQAVEFYENKIGTFYDEIYRQIANFIVECYKENSFIDPMSVISTIQASEIENGDQLINEVTNIAFSKENQIQCNEAILEEMKANLEAEKERISEKDILDSYLNEKNDPLAQARLLAEHNRRKMKKIEQNEKKEDE